MHGPVINQGFFRRFQRKEAALYFGEAQPATRYEKVLFALSLRRLARPYG
jgi:hypothetical protein